MKTKLFTLALAALTIGLLGSCEKEDPKVSVTGVTLDKTTLEITVGDDAKLTATVAPENATDKTVNWSSDKTNIATVDNEGNVHAVAPGTANITVTTTDGGKTATCVVTVKTALPDGALPGKFTVNAEGKQVHFSKGNLTYNVSTTTWAFYEHQYDCATDYDANLISLFTWGYDAVKSIVPDGTDYVEGHTTDGETFSKNEDWGYVFGGESSAWRTLSIDEWGYLINPNDDETIRKGKYKCGVTVCDKVNCLILAPDDFEGTIAASYDDAAWATAETAGLVCLPAAGYRGGSSLGYVGEDGFYWSSTAYNSSNAWHVYFYNDFAGHDYFYGRSDGYSVRLVTEVK